MPAKTKAKKKAKQSRKRIASSGGYGMGRRLPVLQLGLLYSIISALIGLKREIEDDGSED